MSGSTRLRHRVLSIPSLLALVLGVLAPALFSVAPAAAATQTVTVTASPDDHIAASDTATLQLTAVLKDGTGQPVSGVTVNFATDGPFSFTPSASCTSGSNGSCSVILRAHSSDTPGVYNIFVTTSDGGAGGTTVTEYANPDSVVVSSNADTDVDGNYHVPADGTTRKSFFATVKKGNALVANAPVAFSTDGDVTFPTGNTCNTNSDGICSVVVQASTTTDDSPETITAKSGGASGSKALYEDLLPVGGLSVLLSAAAIAPDGVTTTNDTATVTNNGTPVSGVDVLFDATTDSTGNTSNQDVTFTPQYWAAPNTPRIGKCTTDGNGQCSVTIKSSLTAGKNLIVSYPANTISLKRKQTLYEYGSVNSVTITPSVRTVPADGVTKTSFTAAVRDAAGFPVANATVTFGRQGDSTFENGNNQCATLATESDAGNCFVNVIASTTADKERFTATSGGKGSTATLNEYGPGKSIAVALGKTLLLADGGTDNTDATATVTDVNGTQLTGAHVTFHTTGDMTFTPSTCVTDETASGAGCTVVLHSSSTADQEVVSATAGNLSSLGTTVTEFNYVTVALNPSTIPADGTHTSTATATIRNNAGNLVDDGTSVTFGHGGTGATGDTTFTPPTGVCTTTGGSCSITIKASSTADAEVITATSQTHTGQATLTEQDINGRFVPLSPSRIMDTRTGKGGSTLGAGQTRTLTVAGQGGVPASGATAVVMNVTAVGAAPVASYGGFLTVFPTGAARPNASNLNFKTGQTIPNLVTVKLGTNGAVDIYNDNGTTDVLADVVGYYAPDTTKGSRYTALTPSRILDTRNGTGGAVRLGPSGQATLQVSGRGGVPVSGVSAVAVNVTAVNGQPTASYGGYVTAYPADASSPPDASNLNFVTGQTIPNMVIVKVSPGGAIKLYNNNGSVDLLADVVGYFGAPGDTDGARFVGLTPTRIMDTRSGLGANGVRGGGSTTTLAVRGNGGVPSDATSVVVNVTAVGAQPTRSYGGFLTVYPTGVARPDVSNLNFGAGVTIPNLVLAKLGPDGAINIYNDNGTVHVLVDVVGYYTAS